MIEKVNANKKRYLDLINSIKVQDANIPGLLKWLEKSDFFIAPATLKYYGSYQGGLCEHTLKVYDNLVKLVDTFALVSDQKWKVDEQGRPLQETIQNVLRPRYSEDTLKIVALMHDISKTNYFTTYQRNVKNEETGKWEQKEEYKVREIEDRFIFGTSEQASEYIAHTFFPLEVEESVAILHSNGGINSETSSTIIPMIYSKYNLALLLHLADMLACYDDGVANNE